LSCHQTWQVSASRNLPNSIQGVEVGSEDHTQEHQPHSPLIGKERPCAAFGKPQKPVSQPLSTASPGAVIQ